MRFFITLLALLFFANIGFSQTGSISGTVIDKGTGEALPGVIVQVEGSSIGGQTDFDGKYTIKNLAPGTYKVRCSFVSYRTQLIEGIVVKAQKMTPVNIALETQYVEQSGVEIVSIRSSNTAAAIADEMHNKDQVVSGVSGQTIQKSQDQNAADVVKRIPGVTIIDNRFIMVRGLNERYNAVWLNDAGSPSAETDKRAFSFDMIPSGLIDRVLIFKTSSPDLPGDFAGGMVKIYTRAFPDKGTLSVNYQASYRDGTTGATRFFNPGSPTDKWGFDNGYRSIPEGTPAYISRNDANNAEVTKAFGNKWVIDSAGASPDQRFSLMYAQPIRFKKKEGLLLGNTSGLSYTNLYTTYNVHRQDWDSTGQISDYSDLQSSHTRRVSAVENLSLLAGNNKIEFKNLLNQQGRDWVTQRVSNFEQGPNERSYVMGYESRLITSSQLTGDHKSKSENTEYNWALGLSYTDREAPDLRRIKYTKQRTAPDSMYKAQVANVVDPVNGGGRFFSWLQERVYSFDQNLRQKITLNKKDSLHSYTFEVNVGSYAEYKSREFVGRVLGYVISPGLNAFNLTREPINTIFSDENLGGTGFHMDEITSASDKYAAQNTQVAGYGMLSLPFGKHLKLVGGARYEYNEQALQSFVNLDSVSPNVVTRFLLPSFNASYNFNKKTLVRAAFGKTLNRPEFREWSPFYFYDFDFSAGTYGSLYPTVLAPKGQILKVAQIDNYDCRFEFYPSAGDYIQAGIFYKAFRDPIQQVILNSGGSDSRAFTFNNAEYAFAEGIELDMRRNLAGIDSLLHTSAFGNFNIVANLSLIKSKLYLGELVNQETSSPLQGQSPYVVNGGIYYQNDSIGLQTSLLYNVFGPRLYLVGTLDYANIGELPRHTLDLSVTQRVWKWFSLTFAVQDIFNNPVKLVQDTNRDGKFTNSEDDKEIMSYKRGRYFSAGIRVNFNYGQ